MSLEIKLDPILIDKGFADLRSSIEALETSFATEIEGENKLAMISAFNEIKQEYEALLRQFEALFLSNIQSAEDAVALFQETERLLSNAIKLTD